MKIVYAAWCRRVPFDNVLKRIHLASGNPDPLPGDDDTRFFESWLRFGTGGLCWAGNSALCSLLTALKFSAAWGLATMLVGPDPPPNHGTGHRRPVTAVRSISSTHPCCTASRWPWTITDRPASITPAWRGPLHKAKAAGGMSAGAPCT